MYPRYIKVPRNTKGRDFAIGDIHGCFDLVLRAMDAVNFDQSVDRLFPVGDYIDRGPDSWRVLRFLRHAWILGVRGNHEDMLLELYAEGEPHPAVMEWSLRHNGFAWWKTTPDELRQDILEAIRPLPYVRETETDRGTVGFLHAEVPPGMDWATFVRAIEAGEAHTLKSTLWGRTRVRHQSMEGVPGIGRIFVGHTPVDHTVRLGNVYAVDTGAVFGVLNSPEEGRLTMRSIQCQTQVICGNHSKSNSLVDSGRPGTDSTGPFGAYLGH